MGNNYNQLNIEERVMIGIFQAKGDSVRELKRNGCPVHDQDYLAHRAEAIADKRKSNAGRRVRLKSRGIRRHVKLHYNKFELESRIHFKT